MDRKLLLLKLFNSMNHVANGRKLFNAKKNMKNCTRTTWARSKIIYLVKAKTKLELNTCRFLSDAFEEADAVNLSTKSFSCAVELHKNKLSRFTSQKRELKTILIKSFFPSFHFRSLEDPEY